MTAADDTQCAGTQLSAHDLAPPADSHLCCSFGQSPQHGDGQGNHQFGDRAAIDPAGPAQLDATTGHGIQVNHVKTDAVLGNDPQLRQGCKNLFVQDFQRSDSLISAVQKVDQARPG